MQQQFLLSPPRAIYKRNANQLSLLKAVRITGGFWNLLLTKSKRSVANGVRQRKTHWQVRDVGLSPPLRC